MSSSFMFSSYWWIVCVGCFNRCVAFGIGRKHNGPIFPIWLAANRLESSVSLLLVEVISVASYKRVFCGL